MIYSVTEGEKVKDSVAETVQLSHLLITPKTTIFNTTAVLYSNNINNIIDVIIITYPTNTHNTIVICLSVNYDNNSIYFTILTTVDITISVTSNYSNVLHLIY